ncbi:hypothetical protein [Escherichia coli]|uniref:hypothetical protein n=1 Tax=Escherichia coli TaxID=562 RepID=UPI0039BFD0BC
MTTPIKTLVAIIALFVIPAVMAGENKHCVSSTDGYGVTTSQCDNGSVVITSGVQKKAIVCNAGGEGNSPRCEKVEL